MNEILYAWIAAAVAFAIVEMFTATLYGLSMCVGAALVAIYLAIVPETSVTVTQGLIFALTSGAFAYFLPKWFMDRFASGPGFKSGLDAAVGKSYPVHLVGGDWKIKIDGVDYLVADESVSDELSEGKKCLVTGHVSGQVQVRKR